jgi:hypothetical protein
MKWCSIWLTLSLMLWGLSLGAQEPINPRQYEDLSPNAEQLAKTTGLLELYSQLKHLQTQPNADRVELLLVRQRLLERVVGDSLQADAATSRIESEIAQANEFRSYLMDRRDRQENILNIAGIASGGALGVVSSALQLSQKYAHAGNSVGIGAGVIVTGLSIMSLRAQNGHRQEFQFRSNMLAEMFNRERDPTDVYPPAVLAFLHSVPAIDPDHLTRKQRLLRTWVELGRLPDLNSEKGRTKIERVTGAFADKEKLSISDLYDRRAMLDDLRAKLMLMKRDLASFLSELPQDPAPGNTPTVRP